MSSKEKEQAPAKKKIYTIKLDDDQLGRLKQWCDKQLWPTYEVDYARYAFKGDQVNVVAYNSGKLVVQGKKTEDFVSYVLETEITGSPQLGYEEVNHPEWFQAHAGLDESGKGDLFGPLVSATVIADGDSVREWMDGGIQDSKKVSSDKAILALEKQIKGTKGVVVTLTRPGMPKYNELYKKFGSNVNRLLAWMHAKSLEEALKKRAVPWGMLDQFSKQPLVQNYFKGSDFDLRMQPRAEADPVVAAASICARAEYVRQMQQLSESFGEPLLRGASAKVKEQGKQLVSRLGPDALGRFAKLHFRTSFEILGLPVPEKTVWRK